MIRERQLKFAGHCNRMPTDEPINRFVLYESKVRPSLRPGAPTRTYRQQISSHLLPGEKALEATEIWKMAVNKFVWNKHFVVSKKKSLRTYLLSSNDDDDYDERSLQFPSLFCRLISTDICNQFLNMLVYSCM